MQGAEKAAGSPCLQSSHLSASATVPYWVQFADFFTGSWSPGFPRPRAAQDKGESVKLITD